MPKWMNMSSSATENLGFYGLLKLGSFEAIRNPADRLLAFATAPSATALSRAARISLPACPG